MLHILSHCRAFCDIPQGGPFFEQSRAEPANKDPPGNCVEDRAHRCRLTDALHERGFCDNPEAMNEATNTVAAPRVGSTTDSAIRPNKQPRYHVVLLDDDDHTYDYVIGMLRKLFGHTTEQSLQLATAVDETGRVILATTTLERAEFKRDQIHAFGRDWRIPRCAGGMSADVEPVDD